MENRKIHNQIFRNVCIAPIIVCVVKQSQYVLLDSVIRKIHGYLIRLMGLNLLFAAHVV
jgi:hypothetical protein